MYILPVYIEVDEEWEQDAIEEYLTEQGWKFITGLPISDQDLEALRKRYADPRRP